YELLPLTYEKLSGLQPGAYEGAWPLWQEGIEKGLMAPQFHGREHLNLMVLKEKLTRGDFEVLTALKNRSYTSISNSGYPTISVTAAFDFWDILENNHFDEIISSGVSSFARVFGYKPVHFNAPGASASCLIHKSLVENGIRFSDNPFLKKEHLGKGHYKTVVNYTGKILSHGLVNINRNVVFEPGANQKIDWAQYALGQTEIAFKLGKPAVISSHRVNFCGHIDPKNREVGIRELKTLLQKMVQRWPDVEFMSTSDLGDLIYASR
ncbi:MAG TPA: hypothetical protein VLH61_09625, partial [Bacteroidales bacterium]|nr:hypothetical protein [Bacteroidales bacterium]